MASLTRALPLRDFQHVEREGIPPAQEQIYSTLSPAAMSRPSVWRPEAMDHPTAHTFWVCGKATRDTRLTPGTHSFAQLRRPAHRVVREVM